MKIFKNLVGIIPIISAVVQAVNLQAGQGSNDPSKREWKDELVSDHTDAYFEKRDAVSNIESALRSLNDSGIIIEALDGIASSDSVMDNVSDTIINFLETGGGSLGGIDLNVNMTQLLHSVIESGVINSTLDGLLLNENNRNQLADFVGELLVNNVWIPKLLVDLGNGHDLTIDFIADLINNTRSKDPDRQQSSQFVFDKRDDEYSGSASQFLNNVINSVVQSQLVHQSLDDVLTALNNTNIIVSLVIQVIHDDSAASLAKHVAKRIYDSGALNGIDLDSYFERAKREGILADSVQIGLTDPNYSPGLARLFQRIEMKGYYQGIQRALYGP